MLAKSKLNNVETLISQALNDMEIRMKYILASENEKQEKFTKLQ